MTDPHDFQLGIDNPVLRNLRAFVQPPLDGLVAATCTRRTHFDDRIRSPLHVLFGQNLAPLGCDVEQVWFDDARNA